ncbi:MAG: EamA family transporter, partial [Candidatus Ornithospirochaeta sp.]
PALLLGFVSYGLSIFLYIRAQRHLGAAKTSAYYALAPFMGAGISILLFKTKPAPLFFIALTVMGAGSIIISYDSLK